MKVLIRAFSILAIVSLLGQCQKIELPAPEEGTPVFSLQASLDGAPQEIIGGDSSYIMRASFFVDSAGLPVYRGTFEELDCVTNCKPSIRFSFRAAGPGPAQPDTDLRIGDYPFLAPEESSTAITYRVVFSGLHSSNAVNAPITYNWDFGDGSSSALQGPEHEYPDDAPRFVRLETRNAAGCLSSIEKEIAFEPLPIPCEVDFTLQPAQGTTPAQAVFEGPFNLYSTWGWFENDSSLVTSYPIGQLLPQQVREICLTATNTEGCQSETCKSVFLNNFQGLGYCATDFSYLASVDTTFTPVPEQFGSVWLEYIDGTGRVFNSASGPQDTMSGDFFRVISVEPFELNENGQPTEKLEVAFQCRLYDTNGQPFGTLTGTGVIAVAHP
ncbi:MAG: PKD domain-containing protein [Lewinellaceae bacterium]|nr:PKD domain-containing protein [Phaeodactylibacter sp.]MCB0613672.1 PKD domain-containing protein [Phaeodactylibacter sp.]MCB9349440.1 PKD domain-containing protein [Lewinellaceae bacterium]